MNNDHEDTDGDVLAIPEDQSRKGEERDRFFEPWRVPIGPTAC